ncbi:hypothetical protein EU537_04990 [Candidatus Thorarchaeota archaeon]|nr:MAG: hypothetical protein EU537_04990 [Candidatus Thorarchaeota archaeon]
MSTTEIDPKEEKMTLLPTNSQTKILAVGVMLAAVYAVGNLIAISGFIGASGVVASISLAIVIAPLFGILLGPFRGASFGLIAGFLGAYISTFVAGVSLVVPTVIFGPAVSGFLTGLCTRRKKSLLPGPLLTAIYLSLIIALYLIPNASAWWFILPYALAVVVSLVLQLTDIRFNPNKQGLMKYAQLIPLTYIGTMTDFSLMTVGAVYILNIPAIVFGTIIFPAMILERTISTIGSAVVASLVLIAFQDLWSDSDSGVQ